MLTAIHRAYAESFANKLCTVLSRSEERDLVDLMLLDRAGHVVEDALQAALSKDGGCTPAALAWNLSQVSIPDGVELPGEATAAELSEFVAELVVRLRRAAAPQAS